MPVGVTWLDDNVTEVLLLGGDTPRSTTSKLPSGGEEPCKSSEVTTASPRLFVPRSGSMATAMGFWFTATEEEVTAATGVASNGVRLTAETVFEPVLATSAMPVS